MAQNDWLYFVYMAVGVLTVIALLVTLSRQAFKKYVSVGLILTAVAITPVALVLAFLVMDQGPIIGLEGFLTGDYRCGGFHGNGYRSACSVYAATLEAMVAMFIFVFISFGVLPLAAFLVVLLGLVVARKYLGFRSSHRQDV